MPKQRIWRGKIKAASWPCADGKHWSWSIMTGAFYMEGASGLNATTEAEARTDAEWVCKNMGLTITEWHTEA